MTPVYYHLNTATDNLSPTSRGQRYQHVLRKEREQRSGLMGLH